MFDNIKGGLMTNTLKTVPGIERIRCSNLAMLTPFAKGVPMEEALRRADDAGLVIASNKRIDRALTSSEGWKPIIDAFPIWTGTLVAYEEPDVRFGKTFEWSDYPDRHRYVLDVPEEHQGKKNVVLVAEHPNFTIEQDGMTRIIHAKEAGIVEKVPANTGGWYSGDPVYSIPSGKQVNKHSDAARIIVRGYRGIRLVVRGYSDFQDYIDPYGVSISHRPQDRFGVVVEGTPEQVTAAARLIEQMKCK
jgi:hypothetical protein